MQRRSLFGYAGLLGLQGILGISSAQAAFMVWGRPANVILVTGGDFIRYRRILINTANGLEKVGLINQAPTELSKERSDTADVWEALVQYAGGSRLKFLADGHYDYGFDVKRREKVRGEILRRLQEKQDVDLILVFGTEASFDMCEAVKDIPIISLGSSDPVKMGLVKSAERSGQQNFHAIVEEGFYRWQAEVFHTIFPFKKLALITAASRVDKSGADGVKAFCRDSDIGFELQTYIESRKDEETDFQELLDAVTDAVEIKGCDAVIFPWFLASREQMPRLVNYLAEKAIPAFSQTGIEFVSQGILLGAGEESLEGYGLFEADVILQVLDGVDPGTIPQTFVQRSRLAISLYTAAQMGWQPPFELLVSVERAYTTQSPHLN